MADHVNENDNEDPAAEGTPTAQAASPSADTPKGDDPQDSTDDEKAEEMEDVQRDAAKEREENRGYQ